MDELIKIVVDNEIFTKAFIPFALIVFVTVVIILITAFLVNKEVEGVKNEKV